MSVISHGAVRTAFNARLQTFTDGGDVNVTGTDYTPQAGRPYITGSLTSYIRTPVGYGLSAPHDVRGTYQVSVNRPAIEGLATADSVAKRVEALFPRGLSLALATGAVLTVMSASERPEMTSGDWLTVPVVIEWYGTE